MTKTLSQLKAELMTEFEKKFPELWGSNDGREGYDAEVSSDVKSFLSSALDTIAEKTAEACFKVSDEAILRMQIVGVVLSGKYKDEKANELLNDIRGKYEELKERCQPLKRDKWLGRGEK